MKIARGTLAWSAGTVLLAGAVSWLVVRNTSLRPPGPSERTFHEWLHENLRITDAQHEALRPHESAFNREQRRLRRDIAEAGASLAEAIRGSADDPRAAAAALERLQDVQRELQQVTLRHFFVMRDHLDPDQAEKLLRLTQESLTNGPSR